MSDEKESNIGSRTISIIIGLTSFLIGGAVLAYGVINAATDHTDSTVLYLCCGPPALFAFFYGIVMIVVGVFNRT
jgi:hypothetical protein